MISPKDLAQMGLRLRAPQVKTNGERPVSSIKEPTEADTPLVRISPDAPHRKAVDAVTRSKVEAGIRIARQRANELRNDEIRSLVLSEIRDIVDALTTAESHQLRSVEHNALGQRFRYVARLLDITDGQFQQDIEYYINTVRD